MEAGVIIHRSFYLKAIIVNPVILLYFNYLQLLIISDGRNPLKISDQTGILDLIKMTDEVIKLCDLITLVVQFNIVSDLIGDLLNDLQKVVLNSLKGALSHEAELNLLREVDMPNEELYVDAGIL